MLHALQVAGKHVDLDVDRLPLFESALAISGSATVAFTVRIVPTARSVILRRLFDIRRSVARATVRVDGVVVGYWLTADRAFDTIDAYWQEDDF